MFACLPGESATVTEQSPVLSLSSADEKESDMIREAEEDLLMFFFGTHMDVNLFKKNDKTRTFI